MKASFILFALFCILVSSLVIFLYRRHTLNIMRRLENMVNTAIEGTFTEQVFDESRLSALESRFAHFLSSSETSYKNIASEKNKTKELISDISHQTKTPVANILLYSELLGEQDLPEEAGQYVSSLTSQAEKLRFLIDSLVKLSRLETGILALLPEKTPVLPMLRELISQYTPPAKEKGLALILAQTEDIAPDTAATFDRKWTMEAIANLIDNAIKYTEKGSVTLSVVPYEMFLCIQIADTGIGIPEEEHTKIFSRFYRAQTVHEMPGVGVGLFLAREIVMLEDGYIKLSSEPGRGSVFSVYLPV